MFGNWDDVALLGRELTRLKILHLSANRFNKLKYPLPQDHKLIGAGQIPQGLEVTETSKKANHVLEDFE